MFKQCCWSLGECYERSRYTGWEINYIKDINLSRTSSENFFIELCNKTKKGFAPLREKEDIEDRWSFITINVFIMGSTIRSNSIWDVIILKATLSIYKKYYWSGFKGNSVYVRPNNKSSFLIYDKSLGIYENVTVWERLFHKRWIALKIYLVN